LTVLLVEKVQIFTKDYYHINDKRVLIA